MNSITKFALIGISSASLFLSGCTTLGTVQPNPAKPGQKLWVPDEFGVTTSAFNDESIYTKKGRYYYAKKVPYSLRDYGERHLTFKRMYHSIYHTPKGIPNALIYSDNNNAFFVTESASLNKTIRTEEAVVENIPDKTFKAIYGLAKDYEVEMGPILTGFSKNKVRNKSLPYVRYRFSVVSEPGATVNEIRDKIMKGFYGRSDVRPNIGLLSTVKRPFYYVDAVTWSDANSKSKLHSAFYIHGVNLADENVEHEWESLHKKYLNIENFIQY